MLNVLKNFLALYHRSPQKFLLGLSGGPDSMALFYLLQELNMNSFFEVAHVDHGWRKQSSVEADVLKKLCEEKKIHFHLKKLDPVNFEGNLEEACRIQRLQFFKNLCSQRDLVAVMLGHHQGDLAETVLKRIFESARLYHLYGMSSVSQFEGMTLWRPLLKTAKKEILQWNEEKNVSFFKDETNEDPRFLRSRLRHHLLPLLNEYFGKEVTASLCHIAEDSKLLHENIQNKVSDWMKNLKQGVLGVWIDLEALSLDFFDTCSLIDEIGRKLGFCLPSPLLKRVTQALQLGRANCLFEFHHQPIIVDRGRLFFPKKCLIGFSLKVKEGIFRLEKWEVIIQISREEETEYSDWQDLWQGSLKACVPLGDLKIVPFEEIYNLQIKKKITNCKVPAFLKTQTPLLVDSNNEVVHEFLTGKSSVKKHLKQNPFYLIKINYIYDA